MHYEVGAQSKRGVREENQDRITRFSTPLGDVVAIADGMGGHEGGALAARLVVGAIQKSLESVPRDAAPEAALQAAVAAANEAVYQRSREDQGGLRNMGSTLVMSLLTPSAEGLTLRVAHVGDSRAYFIRERELQQITRDHSVLEELIEMGVPAEEAAAKPHRDQLTHALGPKPRVEARISEPIAMLSGDQVLMCSDGLYSFLEPETIVKVLSGPGAVSEKAKTLIQMALAAGGNDNVSVQIIECSDYPPDRATMKIPTLIWPEQRSEPAPPSRGAGRGSALWVWIGVAALLAAALGAWGWGAFGGAGRGETGESPQTSALPPEEAPLAASVAPPPASPEPAVSAPQPSDPGRTECSISIDCRGDCAEWKNAGWWSDLESAFTAFHSSSAGGLELGLPVPMPYPLPRSASFLVYEPLPGYTEARKRVDDILRHHRVQPEWAETRPALAIAQRGCEIEILTPSR